MTEWKPIETVDQLYESIAEFIRSYGGSPPDKNSKEALQMLSDFAFAAGVEWVIRMNPIEAGEEKAG